MCNKSTGWGGGRGGRMRGERKSEGKDKREKEKGVGGI